MKSNTVAPAANLVPESRRREPVADGSGRRQQHRRDDRQHSRVDVEHRERAVQHVVASQFQVVDHQLGLAYGVAVRQHAAFRRPGRARGEQHHRRIGERMKRGDHSRIVRAQRGVIENLDAGQLSGDINGEANHNDVAHMYEIFEHAGEIRHESCVGDHRVGTAEVQCVHQRRTAELGVQQRRHRAERAQRQPRDREVGPVRHQHGHQLATLHTKVGQAAGKTHRPASSFAECQVARRETQEGGVRAVGGSKVEQPIDRQAVPQTVT